MTRSSIRPDWYFELFGAVKKARKYHLSLKILMAEGSYEFIAGLILWLFIPPFVTKLLLGQFYSFRYRGTLQKPKEGSAKYQIHYRRMYAVVVSFYFAYCLVDFTYKMKPNYYTLMGVPRTEITEKLKTHFRHTMINLHPDKNPDADQAQFMRIKQIYEILGNDLTRVSYDVYGPDVLRTVNLSSAKNSSRASIADYFNQALFDWGGFYLGTFLFFILASGTNNRRGLYWRGLALTTIAAMDLHFLMRPNCYGMPTGVSYDGIFMIGTVIKLLANIPTYQKLSFLRQAYMYGSMAIGQLSGLLKTASQDAQVGELVKKAEILAGNTLRKETEFQLARSLEPVAEDSEMTALLRKNMGKLTADIQLFDSLSTSERQRLVSGNKTL